MSRGPGVIQRAIQRAFARSPTRSFSTRELAEIAYPLAPVIEKKHRVTVLKAAASAARLMRWQAGRQPGRDGEIIYVNLLDLQSYAAGQIRSGGHYADLDENDLQARIEDALASDESAAWRREVEMNQTKRERAED